MSNDKRNIVIAVIVFLVVFFAGNFVVDWIPLDYTTAAIIYLAAVIAAGCFWIGRNK